MCSFPYREQRCTTLRCCMDSSSFSVRWALWRWKMPLWRPPRPAIRRTPLHKFLAVARPYWVGDHRRTAWMLLALLVMLMLCETQLAVMLVERTGELTSALASRDGDRFWAAVKTTMVLLAFAAPIYAFYYFMRDAFANHWRKWLTHRFLSHYMEGRRYYDIGRSRNPRLDNPDQRISEDIYTFTGRSTHFLLLFLGACMQLVAFSAVLWGISRPLVAFLAVYACLGTFVALYVFGSPLIRLNYTQLQREADFRFSLIRVREHAESIAFFGGERQERERLDQRFEEAYRNYTALIRRQCALNLFQRAFSQLTLVIPFAILAGSVLSGELEVGTAVQAAGAFAAVLAAVSLIVDNFESLSRFVAGIGRLYDLECSLTSSADAPVRDEIQMEQGRDFAIRSLWLPSSQGGEFLIKDLNFSLNEGDALLVMGPSGCGKSSLLRAVAGIALAGRGTVIKPACPLFFLPQKPYLQTGSLRSQLLYPSSEAVVDDSTLLDIVEQMNLTHLTAHSGGLDAVRDWEKILSTGEQQRLSFARVLVHRPRFLILDESTSALDVANEELMYRALSTFPNTLISIAHRPTVVRFHTHKLELFEGGAWELQPTAECIPPRMAFDTGLSNDRIDANV